MVFTEGDRQYPTTDNDTLAQLQTSAAELGIDPQLLVGDGPLPEEADRSRDRKLLTGFFTAFKDNPVTQESVNHEVQSNAKKLEEVAQGSWIAEIRRRGNTEYRLEISPVGGQIDHAIIYVRPSYKFSAEGQSLRMNMDARTAVDLGKSIVHRGDLRRAIDLYREVKGALAKPFSPPEVIRR